MNRMQGIRCCLGCCLSPWPCWQPVRAWRRQPRCHRAATEVPSPLVDTGCAEPDVSPDRRHIHSTLARTSDRRESGTHPAGAAGQSGLHSSSLGPKVIANARADLARRLAIPAETITVQSVERVEWPDTSLGCPRSGMMYAQVITAGILGGAAGRRHALHLSRRRSGTSSHLRAKGAPLVGSGRPNEAVGLATADMAQRLGISSEDVSLVATIGQEFSADAFYCRATKEGFTKDEPRRVYSGVTILLEAAGRRYEYHASDQEVVFCRQFARLSGSRAPNGVAARPTAQRDRRLLEAGPSYLPLPKVDLAADGRQPTSLGRHLSSLDCSGSLFARIDA